MATTFSKIGWDRKTNGKAIVTEKERLVLYVIQNKLIFNRGQNLMQVVRYWLILIAIILAMIMLMSGCDKKRHKHFVKDKSGFYVHSH